MYHGLDDKVMDYRSGDYLQLGVEKMKRAKFIGVIRKDDSTIISDLLFLLFRNNGLKVALIKDKFIRVGEDSEKRKIEDIEELLENQEYFDYIIFDNLQKKCLYDLTEKFEINALIDDGFIEDYEVDNGIVEIKKMMFNKLKRNGIAIINSDNKILDNYFNSLKDKIIVTYGLSTKSTITASSLDVNERVSFNCSVQRGMTTFDGNEIEQMEFPIKTISYKDFNVCDFLSAISLALIFEISVKNIQDSIYDLDYLQNPL